MEATRVDTNIYISADAVPELARHRQEVREEAWATVRLRERQLSEGQEIAVPLAIDALSTAEGVLEASALYGKSSEIYQEKLAGLQLDCRRLVAEWYRKKRYEYFPASRHFFDAETGDFYSHGMSIRQMTENALRPIDNDPEEVGRRVNERVENETPLLMRKIGGLALGQAVGVRTISECTDKAIADLAHDRAAGSRHSGYNGYVPEIEKLMIRDMRLDVQTGDRLEEQIGLSGRRINHYVIQEALRRRGVETKGFDKTQLHGTQLLVRDDLMDFVRLLDMVASEEWRTNIFMGEDVPEGYSKNYDSIRQEALTRQESLQDMADTAAVFIMDLAEDGFDKRKAPAKVETFVKKLLLDMAKKDIELAPQIFDDRTAAGLREVIYLESIGRQQQAFKRQQEVEELAPGGGYCQGGSCGLESVDLSTSAGKELAKLLNAENGDTIVKDTERTCKCGKNSIVYAYNANKVTKYCTSCKATETKTTK